MEILRHRGYDAILTVAGPHKCPKSCQNKEYIIFEGYLNKNKPDEYHKYLSLLEYSHIILLPTRAECSAITYSEAAATGLPCYTYLTGGVGNYVLEGINGHTLPEGSRAKSFAEQIISDIYTGKLSSLREGAFSIFDNKLNWNVWANNFCKIMAKDY